jgi:hypothetical protein
MLKYVSKFTVDILPSVAATVIGAYIVNHYINVRPEAPAAAVSVPAAKTAAEGKPEEKPTHLSNIPEAGVKAKGMSERTLLERSASEKAQGVEKPSEKPGEAKSAEAKSAEAKSAEAKSAEAKSASPSETASVPAEARRRPSLRERAIAKLTPAPAQAAAPAVAPAASAPTAPGEAATATEERRDANDLARAAIERLRGTGDGASRPHEAARAPEARTVAEPTVRPLPPPILVSTPSSESHDAASRANDPNRPPTPPADIPVSRSPLDLRAEATEPAQKQRTSIGEDMLSAAKSVFHAVLPNSATD